MTGGPAGLQCVLSTSALLGEELSHLLTPGNDPSVPLSTNTTTLHLLPKADHSYSSTISKSQSNLPHLSSTQAHTACLLCSQIIPNKISIPCKVHWEVLLLESIEICWNKTGTDARLHAGGYFGFWPWIHTLRVASVYVCRCCIKNSVKTFVLGSMLREPSQREKLFSALYTWQLNHVGKKMSFLFCVNYMSPQGNIPPLHALSKIFT